MTSFNLNILNQSVTLDNAGLLVNDIKNQLIYLIKSKLTPKVIDEFENALIDSPISINHDGEQNDMIGFSDYDGDYYAVVTHLSIVNFEDVSIYDLFEIAQKLEVICA